MGRTRGYSVVGRKLTTISCKIKFLVIAIVVLVTLLVGILTVYFTLLHDFGDGHQQTDEEFYSNEAAQRGYGSTWYPDCQRKGSYPKYKSDQAFSRGENDFDCYPESSPGALTEAKCRARGCCWNKDLEKSPVRCFYPGNYGYDLKGDVISVFEGFIAPLKRLPLPSRYGDDIMDVRIKVEPQGARRLHVQFYDSEESRYQVPDPKIEMTDPHIEEQVPLYSLNYNTNSSPFNLNIRRTDTETIIFDTSIGGFTFSPQFLQLSSRLPSKKIFGFSDNSLESFGLDVNWKNWLLFSRKSTDAADYGSHPFYICLENDGRAHGVLLLNSNALEVQLQPMPAVTFRTIGGLLDFYFFLGPTPEDVVQQYMEAIGFPSMPPYWAFGLHLSFNEGLMVNDLRRAVDEMKENNVTQDVLHLDVHRDEDPFVYSRNKSRDLRDLSSTLRLNHQRLLVKIAPFVQKNSSPFETGFHHGVFVNDSWKINPVLGMNEHGQVAYPDFGNPATLPWWTEQLKELISQLPVDGIWLDENTPVTNLAKGSLNGCLPDNFNKPPYLSNRFQSTIYNDTLCMDSVQWCGSKQCNHYDVHNLYGHLEAKNTAEAIRTINSEHRTLIVSSSTFAGSGHYAGRSVTQSSLDWSSLKRALSSAVLYGIFGIPYSGTSFALGSEDDELTVRYFQLASILPLFHIHDLNLTGMDNGQQNLMASLQASLELRYELLPFLYSLFHLSHTRGTIPLRSLWFQFPSDEASWHIKSQFMWGSSLMFSPILEKGAKTTKLYFPDSDWFDYYTGELIREKELSVDSYLYSTIKPVVLHVKAGEIVPQQIAAKNLESSRKNPMMLLVALNANFSASGYLFWDDGDCLDSYVELEYVEAFFEASPGLLKVRGHPASQFFKSAFDNAFIEKVKIYGLQSEPGAVTIDSNYNLLPKQITWIPENKVLLLHQIRIPISRETIVEWSV